MNVLTNNQLLIVIIAILQFATSSLIPTIEACQVGPPTLKKNDTSLINNAINACALSRGTSHTLVFPPHAEYYSGSIQLIKLQNFQIIIPESTTINALQDPSAFPLRPALPSYPISSKNSNPRHTAFLSVENCQNVSILGGGSLNGHGSFWWHQNGPTPPSVIQTLFSSQISFTNLKVYNSPWWTIHLYASELLVVNGLYIDTSLDGAHTDGMDIDSSENVLVKNTYISTADDHIAIKSGQGQEGIDFGKPSKEIVIQDMEFGHGGGLAIGSETGGGIENVVFQRCKFSSVATGNAVRIKGTSTKSVVKNIVWDKIEIVVPIGIGIFADEAYEVHVEPNDNLTIFQNLTVSSLSGYALRAGQFKTYSIGKLDLSMNDVDLWSSEGFECTGDGKITGTISNVYPKPCF